MNAVILQPIQRWYCPNCDTVDVTREAAPHTRFHSCPGLKGMTAPMVPEGVKCKVEANEREDWVGKEILTYDADRRPIMNVVTTRDDGTDCVVFAPCATTGRD